MVSFSVVYAQSVGPPAVAGDLSPRRRTADFRHGRRAAIAIPARSQGTSRFFSTSSTLQPIRRSRSEWPWYLRFSDSAYDGESKFAMARLTDPSRDHSPAGCTTPRTSTSIRSSTSTDGASRNFDDEVGKLSRHLRRPGQRRARSLLSIRTHGMEFFEHETVGPGQLCGWRFQFAYSAVIMTREYTQCPGSTTWSAAWILRPRPVHLVGASIPDKLFDGVSLAPTLRGQSHALSWTPSTRRASG